MTSCTRTIRTSLATLSLLFLLPAASRAQDASSKKLLDAVTAGRADEVASLTAAGVAVEPYHLGMAAMTGRTEIVRTLVEGGADPNVMSLAPGERAQSSLAFLAGMGNTDAMSVLLELGADPDYRVEPGAPTPLFAALLTRQIEAVRLLVESGADPTLTDSDGNSAADMATAVSAVSGDSSFADAVASASSVQGGSGLDVLAGGIEVDGTHQDGYQSLSEDRPTYYAGAFTGPCVTRRTPLMDPPNPEPGDGGTGSYRETHVFFVGGMKVGEITPPDCTPLQLGPARYKVSVIGGDFSWVWRCRDGDPECRVVTREETGEMKEREFEVGVEPGPPPAAAEPDEPCELGTVRIIAPDRGAQYSYGPSNLGILRNLMAKAEIDGEDCGHELEWSIEDIGSTQATQEVVHPAVAFTFTGLPEQNDDFGDKRITVRLGHRSDTLSVQVFFHPKAYNNPGEPGIPNWFFYWEQTVAGRGYDLEYRAEVHSTLGSGKSVGGQYDFAADQVFIADAAFTHSCAQRPPEFGGGASKYIDCFAELARHETQHKRERHEWWGTMNPKAEERAAQEACGSQLLSLCEEYQGYKNLYDWDTDLVPNDVEKALASSRGCDWQSRESCTGRPDGLIDLEMNAYRVGWGWIRGGADPEDWSWCGAQWQDRGRCPWE